MAALQLFLVKDEGGHFLHKKKKKVVENDFFEMGL